MRWYSVSSPAMRGSATSHQSRAWRIPSDFWLHDRGVEASARSPFSRQKGDRRAAKCRVRWD